MDCIIQPVSILRKCYSGSRLGYRRLTDDVFGESDDPVTVVVGKENCIIQPVSILRKCYSGSRLGYRRLTDDVFGESDDPVTVVVGKEKREFLVESFVLEESPFRVLIDMVIKEKMGRVLNMKGAKRVIYVGVDAILFEHMLWLMQNDCSSFFQLNLKEIIDFYAQEN